MVTINNKTGFLHWEEHLWHSQTWSGFEAYVSHALLHLKLSDGIIMGSEYDTSHCPRTRGVPPASASLKPD